MKIDNAPGLVMRRRREGWAAVWQARSDLAAKGYKPTSQRILFLSGDDPTEEEAEMIADTCNALQDKMLVWARGGIPAGSYDGTIGGLIRCYQTDPDSDFHKLRYGSRKNYRSFFNIIEADHGAEFVAEINGRAVRQWHREWSERGTAMAHGLVTMLRTALTFGATILDDADCRQARETLRDMKFAMAKPRTSFMTFEQANAIRAKAHELGYHSIALAQAFQFELSLRQRDVIGEWVPVSEIGTSDVVHDGRKWLRGIRWSEIDGMVLKHVTSKRQKEATFDLNYAPMVLEELRLLSSPSGIGPVVISEATGRPYLNDTFRGIWREIADACGIPRSVKNMDSRAGAITEALAAGASLDSVRKMATHSDIKMTTRYSRGDTDEIQRVMELRNRSRTK